MDDDQAAIVRAVRDYYEGWFAGDAARMERALHKELAKRSPEDGAALDETTAEWMVDATRRAVGKREDPSERRIEIEVEDVYGPIASVTVRGAIYVEYLHLVRTPDCWKIVNALWQRR